MRTGWKLLVVFTVALLVGAGDVAADTVVLKSGTQISGEVNVTEEDVRIQTEEGALTIPLDRVARIIRDAQPAEEAESLPVAAEREAIPSSTEGGGTDEGDDVEVRVHTEPATTRDWGDFTAQVRGDAGKDSARKAAVVRAEMRDMLMRKVWVKLEDGTLPELAQALERATDGKFVAHPGADRSARALAPGIHEGTVQQILDRAAAGVGGVCEVRGDLVVLGAPSARAQQKEYPEARMGRRVVVVEHRTSLSPEMAALLSRRMDVAFDEMSVADVLDFLREVTGANITYSKSDLDADPAAVTLRLEGVTFQQILDLVLEGRGLGWSVKDNIIRIRPEGSASLGLDVRVYDGRDLLLNIEDFRLAGRSATLAEQDEDEDEGGSFASGGDWGSDSDWDFDDEDDDDGDRRRRSQSLASRANDLATLITSTVRPRSWKQPAVVWVGGTREDEQDDLWREAEDIW